MRVPKAPQYKWTLVFALFLVNAVNYADRTAITAVYALLKEDLGFTDLALGAMGSLFLWSYALMSPIGGYLGDRVSRTRLIICSLSGWSAVTLLTGLAITEWQLLSMRAALGLVEALYLPAAMALVAEFHDQDTRGTALGILAVGNYLGMVGGGTVGGYLGEHFGWRVPLIVLGVGGLLLALYCVAVLPSDTRRHEAKRRSSEGLTFAGIVVALGRIPTVVILTVAGLLTSVGGWIFINWLPLYFHESLKMTVAHAGFVGSSLVSFSAAATLAFGGYASDRVARRGPHRRMWMQAILILCAAPVLLTFLVTRNQWAIMTALVVYSILRSSADLNIIPLLCDLAGRDKCSTAFGITNMLNCVAGGAGVFVAGALKGSTGLDGVFAGVAGILALDAALLFVGCVLFLKRDLRRAAVEPPEVQ